jgi:hypothetical protein
MTKSGIVLMVCFWAWAALADDRVWTDVTGRTLTAAFVKVEGNAVLLRIANGKVSKVPLARLSAVDRDWVKANVGGGNKIMTYLERNQRIGWETSDLIRKLFKIKDAGEKEKIRKRLDALEAEKESFKADAIAAYKVYMPVDEAPFTGYKQDFSMVGALSWGLRDDDNKQLGYVSLSYITRNDSNKNLKNNGQNTMRLGIPSRGDPKKGSMWFFLSDNVLLQVTLSKPLLIEDGAFDVFMKKADVKGLHALGGWK